jgi:hypothetical protein
VERGERRVGPRAERLAEVLAERRVEPLAEQPVVRLAVLQGEPLEAQLAAGTRMLDGWNAQPPRAPFLPKSAASTHL